MRTFIFVLALSGAAASRDLTKDFMWGATAKCHFDELKAAGVTWIRFGIAWREIEPTLKRTDLKISDVTDSSVQDYIREGNWGPFDKLINEITSRGMNIVAIVGNGFVDSVPQVGGRPLTPDVLGQERYLGALYLHARAVVTRLKEKIKYWQIENEANVSGLMIPWGWRSGELWKDSSFVTSVITTLSKAVRDADPSAKIAVNLHADVPLWERYVVRWEKYVDIIGIDSYPNYLFGAPNLAWVVGIKVRTARLITNKDVVVMETGAPSWSKFGGHSEERQARYIRDAAVASRKAGAKGFFVHTCTTSETPFHASGGFDAELLTLIQCVEGYFGLIKPDGTLKPAYRAYKDAIRTLGSR